MANRNESIGGDSTFQKRWTDLGSGDYAVGSSLETLLAGEDLTDDVIRTRVEGKVGADLSATPTVSAAVAYAAGDSVGGKITLANAIPISAGRGTIEAVILTDLAKQDAALDILFFNDDPSGTTFTDNAAFDLADADIGKYAGHVSLVAANYSSLADNSVAVLRNVGLPFKLAGTTLYAHIVSRGTPTYAAVGDITLRVLIRG